MTCAQVPGWDGDLVDLTQTAAVGIVAGVCSRAVIGVATGVLKSCAVGGIVLYASQYSGFFKVGLLPCARPETPSTPPAPIAD